MPTPSGRNKAGKGSSGAPSANAAKDRRKTLAYDGNLLGTDSESGSGSDTAGEPAQSAEAVPRKGGSKAAAAASTSKVSSKVSKASAPVVEVQRSPGSRRSTRLSGEGVQSGGSDNEGGSSSLTRQAKAAAEKAPSKSAKVVPSKRKQPESASSKTQNTSGTTQPTPPLTDPEESEEQPETSRQSQSNNRSGKGASGSSSQAKKAKADSGQRTSPLRKTAKTAPAPRVSEVADDSFAFVQVDGDAPAPASNVASTSTSAHPVVTSPHRKTSKNSPQRSQTSKSRDPADLAKSLDAVAARREPVATRQPSASDVKGKRRADAMDGSVPVEEASQTSTAGQKSKSQLEKPRKKKKDQGKAPAADRAEAEQGTPRKQTSVPTNTQETPAIRRNQAMRAGLGPPGTPGSIVRRSSSERGRRGSSIGNGFEALPHPSLPTNTLYRHIKADDPPAIRFRTLLTWSVHRLKENIEAKAKEEPRSADGKAAVAIAEALIKDLAEKRIDVSWQPEESAAQDDPIRNLPPNPINVENAEKLVACEAWTARLKKEDEIRNARINQYKVMTESITALINTLPPAPPALPDGTVPPLPDVVTPNFSQPLARLTTREDMLAYGRILCQPKAAPSRRKSVAPPPSSLDGDGDPDVVNADTETTFSAALGELRHHAASLQQSSYRMDQFLKVSNTFIDLQLEETQRKLRDLTLPSGTGGDRAVSAAREGSGLHIAGVAGAGGSSSERSPGLGLTDLLRQISRVSVSSKHAGSRR